MARGLFLVALASSFLLGCVNPLGESQAGPNPGTPVGTFSVNATEGVNTCGAGALGSPASYTFSVTMSEQNGAIYWNTGNGAVVPGTLAADGVSFSFVTSATTDMRATGASSSSSSAGAVPLPACSIERDDTGTGTLVGDSTGVTSFTGTLAFAFTPTEGSSCLDLIDSQTPTFAALPCSMTYAMSAARAQ